METFTMDPRKRYYLLHLLSFHLDRDLRELGDDVPLSEVATTEALLEAIMAIERQNAVDLCGDFEDRYLGERPFTKRGELRTSSEIPPHLTVGDFLSDLGHYL